jgi:hypothetical protein
VTNTGPLAGVKVIKLGGIGPGPHAAMLMADLGADVVRVRRPGGLTMPAEDVDLLHHGKRIVDLDVKGQPQALLDLAAAPNCGAGQRRRAGRARAAVFPHTVRPRRSTPEDNHTDRRDRLVASRLPDEVENRGGGASRLTQPWRVAGR